MKVVSSLVAFRDGKRIRPGVPFEIPDGEKLGAGMRKAGEAAAPDKKLGDIKPADTQEAVKRKTGAHNGQV